MEANETLDTSGLSCPLPVLKSKKKIKSMEVGSILKIIATDPGSGKDIPSWCRVTGQELLETAEEDGKFIFYVKRNK